MYRLRFTWWTQLCVQICEEFNVAVLVTNQVCALKALDASKVVQHIMDNPGSACMM